MTTDTTSNGPITPNESFTAALVQAIKQKSAQVAVIGLGYVGLPLAIRLARRGFAVLGVEKEERVLAALNRRVSHVPGVADRDVGEMLDGQRLFPLQVGADDYKNITAVGVQERIAVSQVFIICVPTPLDYAGRATPDRQHLQNAISIIQRSCELLPNLPRLLVIESTTYPGCTREITDSIRVQYQPLIHVAYSPERIDPGGNWPGEPPKIYGVDRDSDSEPVEALYATLFPNNLRKVGSTAAAETVKCAENAYRFVSISFANEVAWQATALGIDAWNILTRRQDFDWPDWLRNRLDRRFFARDPAVESVPQATSVHGADAMSGIRGSVARLMTILSAVDRDRPNLERLIEVVDDVFGELCDSYFTELRLFCNAPGVDVDFSEAVKAILTKGYGLGLCLPGPGVGGHCIPVDPVYLAWKARERGVHLSLVPQQSLFASNA